MPTVLQHPASAGHLKPRYKFHKVCKIFGVHEDTLRNWMRDGVPLPDGQRMRINYISKGLRGKEFEYDEVERVYQALRGASIADILPFPDEGNDRRETAGNRCPSCGGSIEKTSLRRVS